MVNESSSDQSGNIRRILVNESSSRSISISTYLADEEELPLLDKRACCYRSNYTEAAELSLLFLP